MNFEPDLRNQIVYYKFSGEVNTENLLNELKQHAVARDIKFVAVQSETGIFALNATEDFKGARISSVAVPHHSDRVSGPSGDIPIGIYRPEYEDRRNKIINSDVEKYLITNDPRSAQSIHGKIKK